MPPEMFLAGWKLSLLQANFMVGGGGGELKDLHWDA